MSLHAFNEQFRFVRGGVKNLPAAFWKQNRDDVTKVKATLSYLLYGNGDFVERMHDILYDTSFKLHLFGQFCALELYGHRQARGVSADQWTHGQGAALLGYDVQGT